MHRLRGGEVATVLGYVGGLVLLATMAVWHTRWTWVWLPLFVVYHVAGIVVYRLRVDSLERPEPETTDHVFPMPTAAGYHTTATQRALEAKVASAFVGADLRHGSHLNPAPQAGSDSICSDGGHDGST